MEIGGRFRSADLLDRHAARAIDIAVSPITEEQRRAFGDIPCEVASCTRDSLRCAQPFAIIGIAIFDFGDRFFFGAFDRGEVAGLVVAVGRSPTFFGSRFGALAEYVVPVPFSSSSPSLKVLVLDPSLVGLLAESYLYSVLPYFVRRLFSSYVFSVTSAPGRPLEVIFLTWLSLSRV